MHHSTFKKSPLEQDLAEIRMQLYETEKSRVKSLHISGLVTCALTPLSQRLRERITSITITNSFLHLTDMGEFPSLQKLTFLNNTFFSFPECLGHFPKLVTLDFSCNQIERFSSFLNVESFPNLEELMLNKNNLVSIPHSVSKLPRLREIQISDNPRLRELPLYLFTRCLRSISCDQPELQNVTRTFMKGERYSFEKHIHVWSATAHIPPLRFAFTAIASTPSTRCDLITPLVQGSKKISVYSSPFFSFSLFEQQKVERWLVHLENQEDFFGSHTLLAKRVCDIIGGAGEDAAFQEFFLATIPHPSPFHSFCVLYTYLCLYRLSQASYSERMRTLYRGIQILALHTSILKKLEKEASRKPELTALLKELIHWWDAPQFPMHPMDADLVLAVQESDIFYLRFFPHSKIFLEEDLETYDELEQLVCITNERMAQCGANTEAAAALDRECIAKRKKILCQWFAAHCCV